MCPATGQQGRAVRQTLAGLLAACLGDRRRRPGAGARGELAFPDDSLMPVAYVLHPVLVAGGFQRQLADNAVGAARHVEI